MHEPAILSSTSCIHGSGYESFLVHTLSLWKSMQKCRIPSFFQTNTTALHQGDWLGHITPTSPMSLSEVCTSSRSGRRMHLNHSLKGSPLLMWILCSITLMHPGSFPSSAKMSWKAKTSSFVAATLLRVQLLRPSKFSFSRNLFSHMANVMGSCTASVPRAAPISVVNSTGGISKTDTKHATLTPFFRKIGLSDLFLTMTDTLLLPIFSWVYMCKMCKPRRRGHTPTD